MTPQSQIFSPAKVNLGLSILGRRSDGYHLLSSLFWPLSFGDTLYVNPSDRVSVDTRWNEDAPFPETTLPDESSNIVFKLLKRVENETGIKYSVLIDKRIPMGGGLGGGSSNAGSILKFLVGRQQITRDFATSIALPLGADVPFFLNPEPSIVKGVGEKITPVHSSGDLSSLRFLLIFFPFPCNTADIFSKYRNQEIPFSDDPFPSDSFFANGDATFHSGLKQLKNDLEPIVSQIYPAIGECLDLLRTGTSLYSGLSGSGSTCFAVYQNDQALENNSKVLLNFYRKHGCRSIKAHSAAS